MKKTTIIGAILTTLSPVILSAIFIFIGHPDVHGRISLTGENTKPSAELTQAVDQADKKIITAGLEELSALNTKQDSGASNIEEPQLGATPYYSVDISTPTAFINATNGRGFNEGYGFQCVAGFKEFMFALSGKIVATKTGGASGYANQQAQIEPLGFKWHNGNAGLQNGDWAIFRGGAYGHVAMFYNGKWYGQNQGAPNPNTGNAFNLLSFGTNNVIGYYRPNIYNHQSTPAPQPNHQTNQPQPTSYTPATSHIVNKGDTLGDIILNNGWRDYSKPLFGNNGQAQSLAEKNNIKNRGLIYPAQVINR